MTVLVEACVDSESAARQSLAVGADRLELCRNLRVGGLTPHLALLQRVRAAVLLPLHVMIRPREGDFCYSSAELDRMLREIALVREAGADGVVFGALDQRSRIDSAAIATLRAAARPLTLTFHRAFDRTPDPRRALAELIALGVDKVLTSGQAARARDGMPLLAELVRIGEQQISIIAGGGVRAAHAQALVQSTGVREIHLRAGPRADWVRQVIQELR